MADNGVRRSSLSGHWVAEVVLPDGAPATLHVDLDSLGGRWIGEFDVMEFGVENYPVEVGFAGSSVKLHFAGPDADFDGALQDDGKTLIGAIQFEDAPIPTELRRTGSAQFSEMFLELEAAADDSTLVEALSSNGAQLRRQFNADKSKVRLLMLLSPTCPGCQGGAQVVQEEVLRGLSSEELAVYVVWEPILRTDDERSSRKATTLFSDGRVIHYWAVDTQIGTAFQPAIGLTTEPAWDVYLLYPRGVKWEQDAPPRPEYFMHQLGGRLPEHRGLDGPKLAANLDALLRGRSAESLE